MLRRLRPQILFRRKHRSTQFRRSTPRPTRIEEHRTSQRDHVRIARRNDRLGLHGIRDEAHGHHRHIHRLLHATGKRHLVARPHRDALPRIEAARGHMDHVATVRFQRLRELDGLFQVPTAFDPVGGGQTHGHRAIRRECRTHRIEHLEREAHAVLERAAVLIGALVRQRRQELMQKIPVRAVKLDEVEAESRGANGCLRKSVADTAKPRVVERDRRVITRVERHGGRRHRLPAMLMIGRQLVTTRPRHLGRCLAPRMVELDAHHDVRPAAHAFESAAHGLLGRVVVQADVTPRDTTFGNDRRRLDGHQGRARHRELAQVDLVPVVHQPVLGRILAHGRDHDPVGQFEIAYLDRFEQRRLRHDGNS